MARSDPQTPFWKNSPSFFHSAQQGTASPWAEVFPQLATYHVWSLQHWFPKHVFRACTNMFIPCEKNKIPEDNLLIPETLVFIHKAWTLHSQPVGQNYLLAKSAFQLLAETAALAGWRGVPPSTRKQTFGAWSSELTKKSLAWRSALCKRHFPDLIFDSISHLPSKIILRKIIVRNLKPWDNHTQHHFSITN